LDTRKQGVIIHNLQQNSGSLHSLQVVIICYNTSNYINKNGIAKILRHKAVYKMNFHNIDVLRCMDAVKGYELDYKAYEICAKVFNYTLDITY
jgi:hypothetical protein